MQYASGPELMFLLFIILRDNLHFVFHKWVVFRLSYVYIYIRIVVERRGGNQSIFRSQYYTASPATACFALSFVFRCLDTNTNPIYNPTTYFPRVVLVLSSFVSSGLIKHSAGSLINCRQKNYKRWPLMKL